MNKDNSSQHKVGSGALKNSGHSKDKEQYAYEDSGRNAPSQVHRGSMDHH